MPHKLARSRQIRLYQAILADAPLETDPRSEISHIIGLLKADDAVTMQFPRNYILPLLTHTLFATQTILPKHLAHVKGRLLNAACEASHGTWHAPFPPLREVLPR